MQIYFSNRLVSLRFIISIIIFLFTFEASAYENVKFEKELRAGLVNPVDVALSLSGDVYVLDAGKSRVLIFDSGGKPIGDFGGYGSEPGQLSKPGSLAVSPKGEIIVADTKNDRIQVFNSSGNLLFLFGSYGSKPGQFDAPAGVVVDRFGFIYVADRKNKRVQIFTSSGIFLRFFSTESEPVDLALDPRLNVWALIPETKHIVKYSPYGKKLNSIPCLVNDYNYISDAVGITVDMRGDVYITEDSDDSIKKVNEDRKILLSFGSEGEGRGQFDNPAGITFDNSGRIYIADSENKRVQIFAVTGSKSKIISPLLSSPPVVEFDSTIQAEKSITDMMFVKSKGLYTLSDKNSHILLIGPQNKIFSGPGEKQGELDEPIAMNVITEGGYDGLGMSLYSEDGILKVLKAFDGSPAMKAGIVSGDRIITINGNSADSVTVQEALDEMIQSPRVTLKIMRPGEQKPKEVSLRSANIPLSGKIIVADSGNERVQILNLDGVYEYHFGKGGSKIGQFDNPQGIAMNRKGTIYVADTENHRIQIFNSDGIFLSTFGKESDNNEKQPPGNGTFRYPKALVVDSNNRLYVLDYGNSRIQVFDEDGNFIGATGKEGGEIGQFKDPADITIDRNGFLYVADRGNSRIQIFNAEGSLLMSFGSSSQKGWLSFSSIMGLVEETVKGEKTEKMPQKINIGSFHEISAITVSDGKIYVADYETDQIQVFRFYPQGFIKEDRIVITKTAYPPHSHTGTDEKKYEAAAKIALKQALKALADKTGMPEREMENNLKIESEERLANGQVKLTVSVPKKQPVEKKAAAPVEEKIETDTSEEEFELQ